MMRARACFRAMGTSILAVGFAAGCVQTEDKKEPPPAVEPAPVVPPEPARASVTVDPKAAYTLAVGQRCLEFAGGSKDDAAAAEVAPCNGGEAQRFTLQVVPGGYYTITSLASGKCLDVPAFAMDDAAHVQQYTCNGGANQNWILADAGPGTLRLVARHSGKVLTVDGAATGAATVAQRTWKSDPGQQFKLTDLDAKPNTGAGGSAGKPSSKPPKGKKKAASKP
jgi:ricin-type beta-trefoil lectin protein